MVRFDYNWGALVFDYNPSSGLYFDLWRPQTASEVTKLNFLIQKRSIDFHHPWSTLLMHHGICESEWIWIPHIVKNDEVLNYTESAHNELSDPPICHVLTLISWMHAWVRHTSSVMYFSTVAISITIQSGIPFESWAELSEVTEQLGVEEECEHYCNYI